LELACALYARGRIGKVAATEMSGVDFFTFQRALSERGVPLYTQQMLTSDLQSLNEQYPK
jgi:predicted HTH domain antitoxin